MASEALKREHSCRCLIYSDCLKSILKFYINLEVFECKDHNGISSDHFDACFTLPISYCKSIGKAALTYSTFFFLFPILFFCQKVIQKAESPQAGHHPAERCDSFLSTQSEKCDICRICHCEGEENNRLVD